MFGLALAGCVSAEQQRAQAAAVNAADDAKRRSYGVAATVLTPIRMADPAKAVVDNGSNDEHNLGGIGRAASRSCFCLIVLAFGLLRCRK